MNYLHTKSRNKMRVEITDKLQFIYINTRTLERLRNKVPDKEVELSDEQLIDLEDASIDAAASILGKRKRTDSQGHIDAATDVDGEKIDLFPGDSDNEEYSEEIGEGGRPGASGQIRNLPHFLAVRPLP